MNAKTRAVLEALVILVIVVSLILWILWAWRLPTHVQLELRSTRLDLRVGGESIRNVLESLSLKEVSISENFRLQLPIEGLQSFNKRMLPPKVPSQNMQVTVRPRQEDIPAVVRLYSVDGRRDFGNLSQVRASPETALRLTVVHAEQQQSGITAGIHARLQGREHITEAIVVDLLARNPVSLSCSFCIAEGHSVSLPSGSDIQLKFDPTGRSGNLHATAAPSGALSIRAIPSPPLNGVITLTTNLPVSALSFSNADSHGNPRSFVENGTLTYPAEPWMSSVQLQSGDAIELGNQFEQFVVRTIALNRPGGTLELRAEGTVNKIRTGPAGTSLQDRRARALNLLLHHDLVVLALPILLGLIVSVVKFEQWQLTKRSDKPASD